MKLKITIALALLTIGLYLCYKVHGLSTENNRLVANQEVLLTENQAYKVQDSLSTIKTEALTLKVSELEEYRAKDLQLIKDLELKKKYLEGLVKSTTQTVIRLEAKLRDSIRIDTVYNIADTLKCFSYTSKWLDAEGCVGDSLIDLSVTSRDSLIAIESIVPKKWWFIKLPVALFGYKSHQVNILSKNPNTEILGVEYIKITD